MSGQQVRHTETNVIEKWIQDLWVRIDYGEQDKSTWDSDYLHLPKYHEVLAEDFVPEAWAVEIRGGVKRVI
ncbi:hypothetical protein BJX99DRAFT_264455 [Aspergillus californicus]